MHDRDVPVCRVRRSDDGYAVSQRSYVPLDSPDEDIDELADVLAKAIANERGLRRLDIEEALDEVLEEQLGSGDLAAAAVTYRKLHAAYFSKLDAAGAQIAAENKVRELARLYAPVK